MKPQDEKYLKLFTDLMIERIKSVDGDWNKPWFPVGTMPRNVKGYYYRGINSMLLDLISIEKSYAAPVFMTFMQAKELGCHVLKGEGGCPTVFYKKVTFRDRTEDDGLPFPDDFPAEEPEDEDRSKKQTGYLLRRYNTVFNIDQTNLKEVKPELYEQLVQQQMLSVEKKGELLVETIDTMLKEQSWICPVHLKPSDKAFFCHPVLDRPSAENSFIVVPEKKQFIQDESFYGTLLHEMAHSTMIEQPRGLSYAEEELVAELSSAYSSAKMGIGLPVKDENARYLKAWMKELSSSPEFLSNVVRNVSKAVDVIDRHVNPEAKNLLEKNREIHQRLEEEKQQKQEQKPEVPARTVSRKRCRPARKKGVRL